MNEEELRKAVEEDPSVLERLPYLYRREVLRILDQGKGKPKKGNKDRAGDALPGEYS